MISLCGEPTSGDATLASNFPDAISLFGFNGNYQPAESLTVSEGYWINMASARAYTIQVTPTTTLTLNLPASWSMIGGPHGSVSIATLKAANDDVVSVFGFTGSLSEVLAMESAKGYWINMAAARQVVLTPDAGSPRAVPQAPIAGAALWAESGGHRQHIRLGVAPEQVVALPPAPPRGVLDARVQVGEIDSWQVPRPSSEQSVDYMLTVQGVDVRLGWDIPETDSGRWVLIHGERRVPLERQGTLALDEGEAAPVALTLRQIGSLPVAYALYNYPNPFNTTTRIRYDLVRPGPVSLRILDITGRLVRVLIDETKQAGSYQATWDGRDATGAIVGSGVYQCELRAGAYRAVEKMLLMK